MTESARCDVHDFLNSLLFETDYDVSEDAAARRYATELASCTEYAEFTISIRGTWSAITKSGDHINTHEEIGYHAYTAELLQAVLDSDCDFWVFRADGKHDMRKLQEKRRAEYTIYSAAFNATFGPAMRAAARTVLS